jgi:hypothetical protein
MNDKIDIEGKSSIEIDVILDGLERKLSEEQESQTQIELAYNDFKKQMADIRIKMVELEDKRIKAKHVVSQTKIDIKRVESAKFRKIREERFQT